MDQDTAVSGAVQPPNWGVIPSLTSILGGKPDIPVADKHCFLLRSSIKTYQQISLPDIFSSVPLSTVHVPTAAQGEVSRICAGGMGESRGVPS